MSLDSKLDQFETERNIFIAKLDDDETLSNIKLIDFIDDNFVQLQRN